MKKLHLSTILGVLLAALPFVIGWRFPLVVLDRTFAKLSQPERFSESTGILLSHPATVFIESVLLGEDYFVAATIDPHELTKAENPAWPVVIRKPLDRVLYDFGCGYADDAGNRFHPAFPRDRSGLLLQDAKDDVHRKRTMLIDRENSQVFLCHEDRWAPQ